MAMRSRTGGYPRATGSTGYVLDLTDGLRQMRNRLDVLRFRRADTGGVYRHILGGTLETKQRITQRFPHRPGDQDLVWCYPPALRRPARFVGTLTMARAAIASRGGLPPSPLVSPRRTNRTPMISSQ